MKIFTIFAFSILWAFTFAFSNTKNDYHIIEKDSLEYIVEDYEANNDIETNFNNENSDSIFKKYIELLELFSSKDAENKFSLMLSQTLKGVNILNLLWGLCDKYFYDPDSPYRNEGLYLTFLLHILKDKNLAPVFSEKALFIKNMINRNKVGEPAENFSFTSLDSSKRTLYDIHAKYTVSLFYLSDCQECVRVKAYLKQMNINTNEVKVISIYPDDDIGIWKEKSENTDWIGGFDENQMITNYSLYDLRAFPTIYLLSRNKKVIFKDVPVEALEKYLSKKQK